jgi:acid phosphatase type 7
VKRWGLSAVLVAALMVQASPSPAADPVISAAGDIACTPGSTIGPRRCQQAATARLLAGSTAVLPLGDNQYEDGTLAEFQGAYQPTWGLYDSVAYPVAGNHEYDDPEARGYKDYFGVRATPDGTNTYYSWDLGSWHLVALDSNCTDLPPAPGTTNGCGKDSPQGRWLKADLEANSSACEIAYFHHPKFSSFGSKSSKGGYFWTALHGDGAEIILNGHAHAYERFAPQTPSGTASSTGIVEFLVGTGGRSLHGLRAAAPNSVFRTNTNFGVLRLTLQASGYSFEFVNTGGVVLDSGSGICR